MIELLCSTLWRRFLMTELLCLAFVSSASSRLVRFVLSLQKLFSFHWRSEMKLSYCESCIILPFRSKFLSVGGFRSMVGTPSGGVRV